MTEKKDEQSADVTSLTAQQNAALVTTTIPQDLVRDAGLGTEDLTSADVKPARMKLCQAGSPQRKTDDPKQIAGLNELDFFNELSGNIYGRKVQFNVIKALGHSNVLFDPKELGVVLERDLPDNDPRCQWPTGPDGKAIFDEKGNKKKPAAVKYFNYLLWIPSTGEIVLWSLSSTQTSVAIQLNSMLRLPIKFGNGAIIGRPPTWARNFEVSSFMDKKNDYSWGAVNIATAGLTDESTRELCSSLYQSYSAKKIEVDYEREPGDESFGFGANATESDNTGDTKM